MIHAVERAIIGAPGGEAPGGEAPGGEAPGGEAPGGKQQELPGARPGARPVDTPSARASLADDPRPGAGLTVLLTDDSESNRNVVRVYLRQTRWRIVQAVNGAEALRCFEAEPFDIVLMDVRMPDIDGLTVTRRMREIERRLGRRRTPIVALSALANEELREAAREAGCDAHLEKPLSRLDLLALITKLTGGGISPPAEPVQDAPGASPPGEPASLGDRLPVYIAARLQDVADLSRLIRTGDLGTIREIGHKIRGTGTSYGFARITELGKIIEEESRDGNRGAVALAVESLERLLAAIGERPFPARRAPPGGRPDALPRDLSPAVSEDDFILCARTYDVDPANRLHGQGRRFFAEAFAALSTLRADGVGPGRVDRIQAVFAHMFTPGVAYLGCLVPAIAYERAIQEGQEFVEGPLVIGIHNFHYAAGHADWSGELGALKFPLRPPPENMQVWSGREESGFAAVYGQDLRGFARSMDLVARAPTVSP